MEGNKITTYQELIGKTIKRIEDNGYTIKITLHDDSCVVAGAGGNGRVGLSRWYNDDEVIDAVTYTSLIEIKPFSDYGEAVYINKELLEEQILGSINHIRDGLIAVRIHTGSVFNIEGKLKSQLEMIEDSILDFNEIIDEDQVCLVIKLTNT